MTRRLIAVLAVVSMVGALALTAVAATPVDTEDLRDAVTVDAVRAHQAAFQAAADANGGTREASSPGYTESADYVAELMDGAGYDVTRQVFEYPFFQENVPGEFEQTAPNPTVYGYFVDFAPMDYSGNGNVTAPAQAVDLVLPPGAAANTSTSGCEASDFAGFTSGNIAIIVSRFSSM